MADIQIFSNDAQGFLQLGVGASDTTFTLMTGQGSKFPAYGAGQYSIAVLETESIFEVVKITSRTGDILKVERAQEGTAAVPFPAGALVELRVTGGVLTYLRQLAMSSLGESTPYKQPVLACQTSNTALSGVKTVDGITTNIGDRVLVIGQTNKAENGVYSVQAGAWLREADFNAWGKTVGAIVIVTDGAVKKDSVYLCTNNLGNFVVGADPVDFTQIYGSGATFSDVAMTGTNTSTTPSQNNVSTQIATTAFVKTSGLTFGSVVEKTTSYTITTSDMGKLLVFGNAGAASATFTLPKGSTVPVGSVVTVFSACLNPLLVDVNRSPTADTLIVNAVVGGLTGPVKLNAGDSLTLTSTATGWITSGGSTQLKYSKLYNELQDSALVYSIVFGG